ncbi:MAG: hypothetical protein II634_04515, partial [Lachnospiraceae bacterium]|nr:hypothetical protein [Lachnospiraceae bacterium]
PKNALTKQYEKLFELDGVALEFEEDALRVIAHKSEERKTGARGLRAIMESIMMNTMYRIPSEEDVVRCIITREAAEGTEEPVLIRDASVTGGSAEGGDAEAELLQEQGA